MRPISLKTKIVTPRLEETRGWYRDLLGLEVLEEWDEPGDRGCILGLGGTGGDAFLEIYHAEDGADHSGLSLQFRIEDVTAFTVPDEPRFQHRGPEDRPWGSRYLFLPTRTGFRWSSSPAARSDSTETAEHAARAWKP